jgi:phosphoribosylglycinamide formyltransferase-1
LSCIRLATHSERKLEATQVNLLADLDDPRFKQAEIRSALGALDKCGIVPSREHRTPEPILAWIDYAFGGTWSAQAATGGVWTASDADGPVAFVAFDARGPRRRWLQPWQAEPGVAMLGPFGVVERARGLGIGAALLAAALFSLRERGYRRALLTVADDAGLIAYLERVANAKVVERFEPVPAGRRWRTTVLASGNGSNFQAVLDRNAAGELPLDVRSLIVNRPAAYALERAAQARVPAGVIAWNRREEAREAYDERVLAAVAESEPELVLLLGWMHVLPERFVASFPELLNIHPAFLPLDAARDSVALPDGTVQPAFRGAHAVEDALAGGARWIGASVHRVGLAVDRGEVLARAPLRIEAAESRESVFERLHGLEHRVLPAAILRWCWERP